MRLVFSSLILICVLFLLINSTNQQRNRQNAKTTKKPTTVLTAILGGDKDLIGKTLQTLFTTVDSCIGSGEKGWTDPDLGDFTIGSDSPYCSSKCFRNVFCCAPQKPKDLKVKFIFSHRQNGRTENLLVNSQGTAQSRQVEDIIKNSRNHITWFVHGLINDIYVEPIYNQTRDALLDRDNLVVLVDWHEGNRLYLQSMANVRTVGALLGQLMHKLGVAERSTCTGFSLGSHVCSEAAKYLKKRQQTIEKCEGVDPAGPGYDGCSNDIKLDRSDCKLVVAMHTSQFKNAGSLLFGQGFGTDMKTGSCDFWMNDGMDQPQCDNTTTNSLTKKLFKGMFGKFAQDLEWAWECSHYRAVYYYLSQVRRDCDFIGREAAKCGDNAVCRGVIGDPNGETSDPQAGHFNGIRLGKRRDKRNDDRDNYIQEELPHLPSISSQNTRTKRSFGKIAGAIGKVFGVGKDKDKHSDSDDNSDVHEDGSSSGVVEPSKQEEIDKQQELSNQWNQRPGGRPGSGNQRPSGNSGGDYNGENNSGSGNDGDEYGSGYRPASGGRRPGGGLGREEGSQGGYKPYRKPGNTGLSGGSNFESGPNSGFSGNNQRPSGTGGSLGGSEYLPGRRPDWLEGGVDGNRRRGHHHRRHGGQGSERVIEVDDDFGGGQRWRGKREVGQSNDTPIVEKRLAIIDKLREMGSNIRDRVSQLFGGGGNQDQQQDQQQGDYNGINEEQGNGYENSDGNYDGNDNNEGENNGGDRPLFSDFISVTQGKKRSTRDVMEKNNKRYVAKKRLTGQLLKRGIFGNIEKGVEDFAADVTGNGKEATENREEQNEEQQELSDEWNIRPNDQVKLKEKEDENPLGDVPFFDQQQNTDSSNNKKRYVAKRGFFKNIATGVKDFFKDVTGNGDKDDENNSNDDTNDDSSGNNNDEGWDSGQEPQESNQNQDQFESSGDQNRINDWNERPGDRYKRELNEQHSSSRVKEEKRGFFKNIASGVKDFFKDATGNSDSDNSDQEKVETSGPSHLVNDQNGESRQGRQYGRWGDDDEEYGSGYHDFGNDNQGSGGRGQGGRGNGGRGNGGGGRGQGGRGNGGRRRPNDDENDDGRGSRGGGRRPDWLEGNGGRDDDDDDNEDGNRGQGGGRRPSGGRGSGGRGNGGRGNNNNRPSGQQQGTSGGSNGGAPVTMSLMPDDTCLPSYNVDYKFITTGNPPYC